MVLDTLTEDSNSFTPASPVVKPAPSRGAYMPLESTNLMDPNLKCTSDVHFLTVYSAARQRHTAHSSFLPILYYTEPHIHSDKRPVCTAVTTHHVQWIACEATEHWERNIMKQNDVKSDAHSNLYDALGTGIGNWELVLVGSLITITNKETITGSTFFPPF